MQKCPEKATPVRTSCAFKPQAERGVKPEVHVVCPGRHGLDTVAKCQQNMNEEENTECMPLGSTTGACVPRSSPCRLPVKLLIKDLQLLLGFGQRQSPLYGFCQLEAVPSADAGLGLVVIPAAIIRVVTYVSRVVSIHEAIGPAQHAPLATHTRHAALMVDDGNAVLLVICNRNRLRCW